MAARGDRRAPTAHSPDTPRRSWARDLTERRSAVYARAKHDLEALAGADDAALYAEAAEYVRRWPDHAPDAFRDSPRRRRDKAARALAPGGWAERLLGSIEAPCGYSLHSGHLGLPAEAADPERLNDPANAALWGSAIRRELRGPLYFKLELGEGERVHAHVIAAHDAGLLQLPRDGEIVKPLYDPPGWIAYLMKPPAPYTGPNLARWMIARRRGRLPRLSGTVGVPSRRVWGCEGDPSTLRVSLLPAPQNAPADRSPITRSSAASAPRLSAPNPAPDRSEIMTAELETMIDGAPVASETITPAADQPAPPAPLSPPDRSPDPYTPLPALIVNGSAARIKSITALEAECTSVTAHLAPGSIPDPLLPGLLEQIVNGCHDRAKSATVTNAVRDAKNAPGQLAYSWPRAAKINLIRGDRTKTRVYPVREGVSRVRVLPYTYPRRVKTDQRPAARGPPLRRAESPAPGPPSANAQTSTIAARALSAPRSSISRGPSASRHGGFEMSHPNRARATRAAARSGYPVSRLGTLPAADRQRLLDALNSGEAALVTSPGGVQHIIPVAPAEAPNG